MGEGGGTHFPSVPVQELGSIKVDIASQMNKTIL